MPEVWLTGQQHHTESAMRILAEALLPRVTHKFTIVSANTADCPSKQLDARYLTFDNVTESGASSNYIRLVPRGALDINIRTQPILHSSADVEIPEVHMAHIDRQGDFLSITNPYYFLQDESRVDYIKWSIFLGLPKSRGKK